MNTTHRGRYRKPRNRLTGPLPVVAAALVTVLLLAVGACATDDRTPAQREADEKAETEQAAYDAMTELEQVAEDCDANNFRPANATSGIETADAGQTLIIDHKGEDETTGASIEDVVCVLARLDVPSSILSRIDSTRALDGVQQGEWDGYTAVWSYHPDTGTNIIIEAAS